MKSYCLKDEESGRVFRALLTEQELTQLMDERPQIVECFNCPECLDVNNVPMFRTHQHRLYSFTLEN